MAHTDVRKRTSPAELALNNQVEQVACKVQVSQVWSLCHQNSHNGLMTNVAMVAEMEVMCMPKT